MLGVFDGFPINVHKIAFFTSSIANKRLQLSLTDAVHKLNKNESNLHPIIDREAPRFTTIYEFGIADASDFNYLDDEETNRLTKMINKKPFQTMDFLLLLRYYKIDTDKKTPLKFDYYMLRLTFDQNSVEIKVFHEKGPMRVPPQEIVDLIVDETNHTFSKRILAPLDTLDRF